MTKQQSTTDYVILNNLWKAYHEQGVLEERIKLKYDDGEAKEYRLSPFIIGLPKFEKDVEGNDVVKTGEVFKLAQLDEDLRFTVNKTICKYIVEWIDIPGENPTWPDKYK